MGRQTLINKYIVKDDILYRMYKDKWGTHPRYFINFDKLLMYTHTKNVGGTKRKLHVNDDNMLCTESNSPLPEHIQGMYHDWCDKEIERLLTGDKDER